MKRIIIFIAIVIAIVATIWFNYNNYKINKNRTLTENNDYEEIYQKEIYGTYLTTIINKVINSNEKNNVEKGNNNKYIDNNTNSINVEIKMLDKDITYSMETFYNSGMEQFFNYYQDVKFKCTKIEYHKSTGKVKYLYFEQITQ